MHARHYVLIVALLIAPAIVSAENPPIFPGAEGWGIGTPAGRGGTVYRVSNLNDSGTGSFRAAVEASGARVVIFEVSGHIALESDIIIDDPYLTIAGQTAPPPGVTIRDGYVSVETHDVLIQHLRFRTGDEREDFPWSPDGLRAQHSSSGNVYNVVFDHCSVSWAIDETLDVIRADSVTVSNCIVSEGLVHSKHTKGPHSMGSLTHDNTKLAFLRNLFAHNQNRNPKFGTASQAIFVNNVVYNMLNSPDVQPNDSVTTPIKLSLINNHMVPVQQLNDLNKHALLVQDGHYPSGSEIYVDGNECELCDDTWAGDVWIDPNLDSSVAAGLEASSPPIEPDTLTVLDADSVVAHLILNAGAFPDHRDDIDERIVDDLEDTTGTWVDCVDSTDKTFDSGTSLDDAGNLAGDLGFAVLDDAIATFEANYVGLRLKITAGTGAGQDREVVGFTPSADSVVVDTSWVTVPDGTSSWEIYHPCDSNAGGWGDDTLIERDLFLPVDYGDTLASGYTRLEEWIHTFPKSQLDSTAISNVDAYNDSSDGGSTIFTYQYELRVSWETDRLATSKVKYREQGTSTWTETSEDQTGKSSHYVEVTGLDAGTTYELQSVSRLLDGHGGSPIVSTGAIETATTEDAETSVSSFDMSFAKVGNEIHATFTYTTGHNTTCKINVRADADPPGSWGSDEVDESSSHGTSHTHVVEDLMPNSTYNAYVEVEYNSEDTMFPDGAVADETNTSVYVRFTTPNKQGQGGGYDYEGVQQEPQVPGHTVFLRQNYPNPFNPSTTIEYGVSSEGSFVHLRIYDVQGRIVRTLVEQRKSPGAYRVTWKGDNDMGQPVAAGVYFLRLDVGTERLVRKTVLVK